VNSTGPIFAEPTATQLLTVIADLDSGAQVDVERFIRRELKYVMRDRSELRRRYRQDSETPWLVCLICGAPVQLVSHTDRSFYFRHMPEAEDRGCLINTKGNLTPSQINALKYNGAKESQAHQRLKGIVRDSILADPRFDTPQVEKVWRGMSTSERATWRKPDVQVSWGERRLVFEIQLSTTFLSVIVDRKEFYRAEQGSLIWIFQSFDPNHTRRAEEDIFYNNNQNVFIVNEETLLRSRTNKRLSLDCWHAVPVHQDGEILDTWKKSSVFIDELHFDLDKQRVYFHDYDQAIKELQDQKEVLKQDQLRDDFEEFWRVYGGDEDLDGKKEWKSLRARLLASNLVDDLPESYWVGPFNGVVSLMLSAKKGAPFGYRFKTLLEVTNVTFNSYKHYLWQFGWALKLYGHETLLGTQDKKGTWQRRKLEIRKAIECNDPAFARHTELDKLMGFLLPKLQERLRRRP
jgi:hypothetical protein